MILINKLIALYRRKGIIYYSFKLHGRPKPWNKWLNKNIQKDISGNEMTLNFFTGLTTSNSDICGRGQSAFMPDENCTIAPKFSTAITFAFTIMPGLTSEWAKTGPSKTLACMTKAKV